MHTQQSRINDAPAEQRAQLPQGLQQQQQSIQALQAELDALRGKLRVQDQTVQELQQQLKRKQQIIQQLKNEVQRLKQRLAPYEPEVLQEPQQPAAETSHDYSVAAEEKRRKKRNRKKKSPGRRPTALKFSQAQQFEDVVPPGWSPEQCRLVQRRAVCRLIEGRAVWVGYSVYRSPDGQQPAIPGVTARCEYGLEILVVLAFLVYVIGISPDKVCELLAFFCQLPIRKSQVESLLRQLARHWETEFETLCDLVLHATVVYMDETGWKVGPQNRSLWTFASDLHRVFLFGCSKDAATLEQILPATAFEGIGVSDDAAVYRDRFGQGQKCWAHLLRKAIRLTLLYPRRKRYKHFLDQLLGIFYLRRQAGGGGPAAGRRRPGSARGRVGRAVVYPGQRSASGDDAPAGCGSARLLETGVRTFALGGCRRVVHVRAGPGSRTDEQPSRASGAECGGGPQDRPHQQNVLRCAATEHHGQRAGILTGQPGLLHVGQRGFGSRTLAQGGHQPVWQATHGNPSSSPPSPGSRSGLRIVWFSLNRLAFS